MINLVKQAQQGDAAAFGKLARIYQDSFYRIARSRLSNDEDTADAIQEALLSGWEKLPTLRGYGSVLWRRLFYTGNFTNSGNFRGYCKAAARKREKGDVQIL